jgi:hypothetical protein
MRKIIYFVLMCLYILGAIGGVGYALYNHAYLIAIGVVVVAAMALPQVVKYYQMLTE